MELKAPKPLGLLCSSCSELFLFLVAKLGGCQQTGEFLPELLGVSPRESDKPGLINIWWLAGQSDLSEDEVRCESPPASGCLAEQAVRKLLRPNLAGGSHRWPGENWWSLWTGGRPSRENSGVSGLAGLSFTFAGVMTLSRLEVEAPFLISPPSCWWWWWWGCGGCLGGGCRASCWGCGLGWGWEWWGELRGDWVAGPGPGPGLEELTGLLGGDDCVRMYLSI